MGICGDAHGEKFGKEFWSKQRVISGPELGGPGYEALVINSQFFRDFGIGGNFCKMVTLSRDGSPRFKIPFYLRRGEVPKDKSDDLAFLKVEVDRG